MFVTHFSLNMRQMHFSQFRFCPLFPFHDVKQGKDIICTIAGAPKLLCIYHYHTQTIFTKSFSLEKTSEIRESNLDHHLIN